VVQINALLLEQHDHVLYMCVYVCGI
jgi:hypothetical protein